MSGSHPRQFLQEAHFEEGQYRELQESLSPRTKNGKSILWRSIPGNYLRDEQLSRERKLSVAFYLLLKWDDSRRRRRGGGGGGGCEYADVVAIMGKHRRDRARNEEEGKDTCMTPATATLRRASRCFRRETIVSCLRVRRGDSEGESGAGKIERRMADSARRIVAELSLRLYVRKKKGGDRSREIKNGRR